MKIRDEFNVLQGKNFNRLYLSYYYAALHDLPKANRYAQEALAISKSFKAPKDELMCLKQLIKINPKKALTYSSQYISLTDSMQKIERQSRNKFAKIAFETDEITKQKAAVEEQYTRIVWVCLIISVILILLFVIGKQLLKQKEFRLQHVQQQVNVEIYNLLLAQQNKIDNARNSEKERISKDLHDGVLNRLASTRMNLTGLISQPTADNIKKSRELIEGIQGVEKEIRNISHDLNKDILMKSVSFVNVITTYMEEQYEATQIKNFLEFDSKINWDRFPGIVKIHLYRIVQESMQNIAKHAHASSIILSFLSVEGGVRVEIFDDGVGFLLNKKKKGIGLQNIYSRTASCNGTVLIESKKGIGTTIKVVVPYQD
ncbi:MAG: sensor histidine kinase [Flavobacterium sp.]